VVEKLGSQVHYKETITEVGSGVSVSDRWTENRRTELAGRNHNGMLYVGGGKRRGRLAQTTNLHELGGETGSPGAGAGKSDGIRRVAARVVTASQSCEDGEVCGGARSGSEQEAEAGVEMERAEEQRPGLPWRDGRGGWCEV
jgi:hypothetical protein